MPLARKQNGMVCEGHGVGGGGGVRYWVIVLNLLKSMLETHSDVILGGF